MDTLREGSLRVFAADTPTGLFHLAQNGLSQKFRHTADTLLYRRDWFTAVQEGNKALLEIIDRGMASISDQEKNEIRRRWIDDSGKKSDTFVIAISSAYTPLTFVNSMGGLPVCWSTCGERGRKRPGGEFNFE